jgi:hypothetical protein
VVAAENGPAWSSRQKLRRPSSDEKQIMADAICIDVGPYLQHKIEAIPAHHSQFPIQPDMLPLTILQELMGQEHCVRVSPAVAVEPGFQELPRGR